MERVLLVWLHSSSESSCLNSLLSIIHSACIGFLGQIESKGESAQPLQSRQSEFSAVSPEMEYFEQLDKDGQKNLNTVFIK